LAIDNLLFHSAYDELLTWCREHDFAGHDPFDALNSPIFQKTPLAKSRHARLVWTQLVKRSPADLRPLAGIPAQRNSKGIALFALALISQHRRLKTPESENDARDMLDVLLSMKNDGYSGAAWGYNFDWQSRNFFAPRGTPTIVPTAFAGRALLDAADVFNDDRYFNVARSICEFIRKDLHRSVDTDDELCFSYSTNSNTQIYNANLLAGEILAGVGTRLDDQQLCGLAERSVRHTIRRQNANGSWFYGIQSSQGWVDSFHTAFVLFSLSRIIVSCRLGAEFQESLTRGYEYWIKSFFLADGWPKYYDGDPYPADAHAGASAIVSLVELAENSVGNHMNARTEMLKLAEKIAKWSIENLRDKRGFFYYQRRRFYTVRTPYMRWSQAWMLYALARLLEASQ
jgi:hypothetical protein